MVYRIRMLPWEYHFVVGIRGMMAEMWLEIALLDPFFPLYYFISLSVYCTIIFNRKWFSFSPGNLYLMRIFLFEPV